MRKIAFFTGAGISQESGLPTFRDPGGLWKNFDPAEVCSLRGFNKNRKANLDFHNAFRALVDKAEPNAAHLAIAALEKDFDVTVVTQNIDDLHERAGSTKIIKIHGDIYTAKLKRYKRPTIPWREDILLDSFPTGHARCKGSMRHDVVFFGEQLKRVKQAREALNVCELLVVCGTSLQVYPAAGFVLGAWRPKKIYIDPRPNPEMEEHFDEVIKELASIAIPRLSLGAP